MAKTLMKSDEMRAKALASALLKTGAVAKAATACGMTEKDARALMAAKGYKDIFILEYSNMLMTELGPMAINQLKQMLSGKTKTDRGMIDVCKTVLDRIGLSAAKPLAYEDQAAKPMESMSIADLQAKIRELEASMPDVTPSNAPKVIEHAPQLTDLLD